MKNVTKTIETASNLAIIVVAILLGAVLIRSYLLPGAKQTAALSQAAAPKSPKKGDAVVLSNVDWRKNDKTLLLVLSNTCHFCTQSGPFYQRLVKEHGNAQLIAVVPQAADQGQAYLKRLGVDIGDVRQVSFSSLGVSATPTLLLVDNGGKVTDAWVGALPADKEMEVISRLRADQASP